jgi:hypothetical protein
MVLRLDFRAQKASLQEWAACTIYWFRTTGLWSALTEGSRILEDSLSSSEDGNIHSFRNVKLSICLGYRTMVKVQKSNGHVSYSIVRILWNIHRKLVYCFAFILDLSMMTISSSKMLVDFRQTALRYVRENRTLRNCGRQNPKCPIIVSKNWRACNETFIQFLEPAMWNTVTIWASKD